jgi:hypothetical protein
MKCSLEPTVIAFFLFPVFLDSISVHYPTVGSNNTNNIETQSSVFSEHR